jgi:glycosyltransferase involved in cell wall biosynthesis
MNKKNVSFVLAIYNAERTLREALNAILNQDYPRENYEIIIVDGGSEDKTVEIVEDFMKEHKNIKLIHNPYKFSEGKGMGRDQGIKAAKNEILVQLDHDNILKDKNWLNEILFAFDDDDEIGVVQSLLDFRKSDNSFIKYLNSLGVEDPFAAPYSLVSQVTLSPKKFKMIKNKYFVYQLKKKNVLFAGANGCAFKREIFDKIGGWTRDVDVFAEMAKHRVKVAVIKDSKVVHDTTADLNSFLKKKGTYFHRFITEQYKEKSYKWVEEGFSEKVRFALRVIFNLSLIGPSLVSLKQSVKTKNFFWFWHPILLFLITLEYSFLTLLSIRNFFEYI